MSRIALATFTLLLSAATFSPSLSAASSEEGVMQVASFDGTLIDIIVCKPAAASAAASAPVVLQSHGWGGSRWADCGSAQGWMDAGWGAVSISQRGFGNSGGEAHVHDPLYEGRDMIAVLGSEVTVEMAGVASQLATGETLYLTVSPVSDMSAAHGSRAPGVVLLEDVVVDVPLG